MIATATSPQRTELGRKKPAELLRVIVSGTNPLLTSVWSTALASHPGLHLVGTASTLEETLPLVPHCDILMFCPGTQVESGVEWVRILTRTFPESQILVVGIPHQEHVILAFVEAGACAYVPQDETLEGVLRGLEATARGEAYVAPEVAPALIGRLARLRQAHIDPDAIGTRLEALTAREREILELVASQLSNRDIARQLSIEVGTVKNHVHSILEKMSVESRHQAGVYLQAAHLSAGGAGDERPPRSGPGPA